VWKSVEYHVLANGITPEEHAQNGRDIKRATRRLVSSFIVCAVHLRPLRSLSGRGSEPSRALATGFEQIFNLIEFVY
jgi:hypothetical protein